MLLGLETLADSGSVSGSSSSTLLGVIVVL